VGRAIRLRRGYGVAGIEGSEVRAALAFSDEGRSEPGGGERVSKNYEVHRSGE
jgi:hypothetical protein